MAEKTGVIYGINGPVIYLKDAVGFKMAEMVYVGADRLVGEVISCRRIFVQGLSVALPVRRLSVLSCQQSCCLGSCHSLFLLGWFFVWSYGARLTTCAPTLIVPDE